MVRSCPVSIGWVPKRSDISRAALWASVALTSQTRNLSVHQAGFTFKLTPDESNSVGTVTQELKSALAEASREPCSSHVNSRNGAVAAPFNISLQVDRINLLIFSLSHPSVLSAQMTLLGIQAQLMRCPPHRHIAASADSLLITDKRALVTEYRSLVSMLPDSGCKCLEASVTSDSEVADGESGTTIQRQGTLLTVLPFLFSTVQYSTGMA